MLRNASASPSLAYSFPYAPSSYSFLPATFRRPRTTMKIFNCALGLALVATAAAAEQFKDNVRQACAWASSRSRTIRGFP